jgi:hypothetical protein
MIEINYKLVYDMRHYQDAIYCAESALRTAEKQLDKAKEDYMLAARKFTGIDDLEESNYMCMAKGIERHVYTPNKGIHRGVGHRKCIFCGLDDFDD